MALPLWSVAVRSTRPPAAVMRARSSGRPGLWSSVSDMAMVLEPPLLQMPSTAHGPGGGVRQGEGGGRSGEYPLQQAGAKQMEQ